MLSRVGSFMHARRVASVAGAPLSITGTLPVGVETGEAWTGATITASGGTPPYSFAVVDRTSGSAAAIPGLALSGSGATRTYSGTHSGTAGTLYANRAIRVTDAASATADLPFELVGRFAVDLTPPDPWNRDTGDGITSWWTDSIGRSVVGGVERLIVGAGKTIGATGNQGGNQTIYSGSARSLEIDAARIVRTGIDNENDHQTPGAHQLEYGAAAGQLWGWAQPHSTSNAADAGDVGRYDFYHSPSGLVDDLYRAIDGGPFARTGFEVYSGQHNYCRFHPRTTDGRIVATIMRDVGQEAHTIYADDPRAMPTYCRPVYNMDGLVPGDVVGSAQLYHLDARSRSNPNIIVDYLVIHPSASQQPIKRATRNLLTGQVFNAGVAIAGQDFYATSGGVILTYGATTTAIYTPPAGHSVRVQRVCKFGEYAGGFALVGTQQNVSTPDTTAQHFLLYCDPTLDPDTPANWNFLLFGVAGDAGPRFYTHQSTYTGGIDFIRTATGVRLWRRRKVATDIFQIEQWGGTTGASLALEAASGEERREPRPTRIHGVPYDVPVKAIVDNVTDYSSFTNMAAAGKVLKHVRGVGIVPPLCTVRPKLSGGTAQGDTLTCDGGTWLGSPTLHYTWARVPDITLPPSRWPRIPGATAATYVRQAGDGMLACLVEGTNTHGGTGEWSDPSAMQGGPALWTPADISGLVWHLFDAREGMTDFDDLVSNYASAAGSSAAAFAQATSGERPFSSLYGRRNLRFRPTSATAGPRRMTGDATIADVFRARSAVGMVAFAQSNAVTGINRAILFQSRGTSTADARFLVRQNTSNAWQLAMRTLDAESGATTVTGPSVSVNADVMLAAWANFAVGGSQANLSVNGATPVTAAPPSAAATSNTAAQLSVLGTDGNATGTANFDGRMYANLLFAKTTGALTTDEIQRMEAWLAHSLRLSTLLPGGHPYKSARPTL